jgi:hypothetical protein
LLLISLAIIIAVPSCNGGGNKTPTSPTYPTGKPTGLKATAGSQSAELSWNPVPGASGYFVYISTDGVKFTKVQPTPIETTTFLVLDLVNEKIYYFGVSAVGSTGWETSITYLGGAPTAKPVKPQVPVGPPNPLEGVPPAPPKNLQGVAKDSSAELNWDPSPEGDFAHYAIYRRDTNTEADFSLLLSPYDSTSFRDTDLTDTHTYTYYITAWDDEATPLESDPSNVVALTPLDFPPEILSNLNLFVNAGRIVLEWNIPVEEDIAGYAIMRTDDKSTDPGTGAQIVTRFVIPKPTHSISEPESYASGLIKVWVNLSAGTITLQDSTVEVGLIYTYRIAAIDATGQEGPPATKTAEIAVY